MEKFKQIETNAVINRDIIKLHDTKEIKKELEQIIWSLGSYENFLEETIIAELKEEITEKADIKALIGLLEENKKIGENRSWFKEYIEEWENDDCYKNKYRGVVMLKTEIECMQKFTNECIEEFYNSHQNINKYYDKLSKCLDEDEYQYNAESLKGTFSESKRGINKAIKKINQILIEYKEREENIERVRGKSNEEN